MDIQDTTQIQEVKKALVVFREMNADALLRQQAYYREKQIHDEISALAHARREGKEEGLVEGSLNTLFSLVKKGLLSIQQAAEEANITVSEFEAKYRRVSGMLIASMKRG